MPQNPQIGNEGEGLPKTKKSADWLSYADKKAKEFRDYHGERNMFGQVKNPAPLQDDYSKLLSQNELEERKVGMDLLRQERKEEGAATMQRYKQGGRVASTGPAQLHKGEAVVRKSPRKKPRSKSR
jgi:hypothetical protein